MIYFTLPTLENPALNIPYIDLLFLLPSQGYSAIPVELNYHYLRRVRGDNYCGVRAALYQVLSMGLPVPSGHATHTRLAAELNQGSTWLQDWSFGQRLSFSKEQVLNGFWECLEALDSMVSVAGRGRKGMENAIVLQPAHY